MIRVQKRDQKVARDCYEQQFIQAKNLIQSHFKGAHKSEAYRRIQELEKAGYLRRVEPFPGSSETVIRLTKKGYELARQISPWDIPYTQRLNLATLGHDAIVTSVRLRLEELWDGEWVPEVVLRQKQGRHPQPDAAIGDGMLVFPQSGKKIVVEVENSLKSADRYQRIFRNWSESPLGPLMVLYVATEQPIFSRLQRLLKEIAPKKPFGLVLFEDLMKDPPPSVWTIRGELKIFERREY